MTKAKNEAKTIETAVTEKVAKVEVTIPFNYQDLLTEHKTKSGIIRFLNSKGYKNGPIAKYMGIRFQHVRNVLVTPVKKVEA